MGTSTASEHGRALSLARWGNQKPIRIARELASRAAELPTDERQRLLDALQDQEARNTR